MRLYATSAPFYVRDVGREFYKQQNGVIDSRLALVSSVEAERAAVRCADAVGEVKLHMMWAPEDNSGSHLRAYRGMCSATTGSRGSAHAHAYAHARARARARKHTHTRTHACAQLRRVAPRS